jgi:hypothetical protein
MKPPQMECPDGGPRLQAALDARDDGIDGSTEIDFKAGAR